MTFDLCNKFDLSAVFAECRGLVKGQVVHGHNFGRSAKRNPIPAQQPRDLQIAWCGYQTNKDERGWGRGHVMTSRLLLDSCRFAWIDTMPCRPCRSVFPAVCLDPQRLRRYLL